MGRQPVVTGFGAGNMALGWKTSKDTKPSKKAKSTETSKGSSKSQPKSIVKSAQAEETMFEAGDTQELQNQGQDIGNTDDQPNVEEAPKHDWFKKPKRPPTLDSDWNGPKQKQFYGYASNMVSKQVFSTKRIIAVTHVKVMKWYDHGYLEEIEVRREYQQLYKFKEERDVIFDLNVALWMFAKPVVILKRVEDLQLGVKIYQKKLNITKPETFRSDISKTTPYTAYSNPQGIIYVDKYKRNRLMRLDELYKFSDGTLTFVRSVLHNIASNVRMDYLPKRRWSTLDKQRSRIVIKVINKLQLKRMLMRNLEKFVGGSEYGEDFRLLKRTI
ncbi:hypothetical protein Tco_1482321 [Tanacetum coccineum]